jgi:hypothetical protein
MFWSGPSKQDMELVNCVEQEGRINETISDVNISVDTLSLCSGSRAGKDWVDSDLFIVLI